MNKRLFNIMAIALLCMGHSLISKAQVTYFDTNNFLLNYFTNTGSSAYDWRFEPQKTDYERGQLKGSPVKIVTNITDNTGRGFGTHFTDTTYYNPQGNITKVVALKKDEFNPKNIFQPDVYTYEYTEKGVLKQYVNYSQVETRDGKEWRANVHIMPQDNRGNIMKEQYQALSHNGKEWEKFSDTEPWTFTYDTNGKLIGGMFNTLNMKLTYKNGQLVQMQEGTSKPATYTYDLAGHLTSFKYFMIDGMDIEEYFENGVTLTYNEKGNIVKAVKTTWECTSKWVRRKALQSETYTMTYTYDPQGNWTKVVVNSKTGKQPSQKAFIIERSIEYGESIKKPIVEKKDIILHPTFLGIPLDQTCRQFIQQLKLKGFIIDVDGNKLKGAKGLFCDSKVTLEFKDNEYLDDNPFLSLRVYLFLPAGTNHETIYNKWKQELIKENYSFGAEQIDSQSESYFSSAVLPINPDLYYGFGCVLGYESNLSQGRPGIILKIRAMEKESLN